MYIIDLIYYMINNPLPIIIEKQIFRAKKPDMSITSANIHQLFIYSIWSITVPVQQHIYGFVVVFGITTYICIKQYYLQCNCLFHIRYFIGVRPYYLHHTPFSLCAVSILLYYYFVSRWDLQPKNYLLKNKSLALFRIQKKNQNYLFYFLILLYKAKHLHRFNCLGFFSL